MDAGIISIASASDGLRSCECNDTFKGASTVDGLCLEDF